MLTKLLGDTKKMSLDSITGVINLSFGMKNRKTIQTFGWEPAIVSHSVHSGLAKGLYSKYGEGGD